MFRLVPFALVILLLAACASSQASTIDSGVEGGVTIGPTCPVVRPDQPCPNRLYQVTLTVFNQAGKKIAQIQTDVNGLYRLELQPGDFIMHPESPIVMPQAQDQPFTVFEGQFTHLDIVYDSGIR
jgi:hypothetical protein